MPDETTAEEVVEEETLEATPESEGEGETPTNEPESPASDSPEEEEEDIPVRPNASYIIERQKRKIEQQREELQQREESDPVEERLKRIEEMVLTQAEDRELSSFLEQNPEAREYQDKIKAYMGHEAYKDVAPEVIFHHVSYNDRQAKRSRKRNAAELDASQSKTVGSDVRETKNPTTKTAEDIKNMTDEEFAEWDREQQRLARA